jgi:hypothetical protein
MSLIVEGLQLHDRPGGVYFDMLTGRHELPASRFATSMIPFWAGQRQDVSLADRRRIELESRVLAIPNAAAHQAWIDDFKRRLDPSRSTPVLIRDTLPSGLERFGWAWPRALDVERVGGRTATPMHAASVALEGLDPFWYSPYGALALDDDVVLDDDELLDAGGEIVVTSPITEITFDAGGSAEVQRVRVRFVGASSAGVGIENLTTPELVGFTSTEVLAGGDRITVDNFRRRAHRDLGAGLGSIRASMTMRDGNRHGEYLRLLPGSNTLRVLGAPAEARISFFRTWL